MTPFPFFGRSFEAARWLARAALACACVLAAACGGGGDDSPPPGAGTTSVSGKVAAGSHLANAVVFLDLNDNNVLDSNEPRTTTDATGGYTLGAVSADDLARPAIVVRVVSQTRDATTGELAGLDLTMKAPPGAAAFVSPYSTLVASLMGGATRPTQAAAAAQVAVKTLRTRPSSRPSSLR